jgi:HTH-type transcriptional regulator/antitoxin HigA
MDVRVIRSEDDYDWAMSAIEPYFENQPDPGTPEAERFAMLAALLKVYEDRFYPIDAPEPPRC